MGNFFGSHFGAICSHLGANSSQKDEFYLRSLVKFRKNGRFSTELGMTEVLLKNKSDIHWRDYTKVAFQK